MEKHPNVIAVRAALHAAGAGDAQVVVLDEGVHTAPAAAAALGVTVGQIANSLIFDADGEPLLVLASGAHRVDTAKVATLLGVGKLRRATPEFVREHTGQPIGGVAPIHPGVRMRKPFTVHAGGTPEQPAERHQMRTLIDKDLYHHDEVWAAAGVPQAVFRTTPDELQRLTGGEVADVAAG